MIASSQLSNLQFWKHTKLAFGRYFVNFSNFQFCQFSNLLIVNFWFWQLSISSNLPIFNFDNIQFCQFSIMVIFNFTNFQVWPFSSKIFQSSQSSKRTTRSCDLKLKRYRKISNSQNIDYCVNYSVVDTVQRTPLKLAIGGQHVLASKILIEFDPSSPFDLTVLNLAKVGRLCQLLSL